MSETHETTQPPERVGDTEATLEALTKGLSRGRILYRWTPPAVEDDPNHCDVPGEFGVIELPGRRDRVMVCGTYRGRWHANASARLLVAHLLDELDALRTALAAANAEAGKVREERDRLRLLLWKCEPHIDNAMRGYPTDRKDAKRLHSQIVTATEAIDKPRYTPAQMALRSKSGTPAEFAMACEFAADRCVITTDECNAAIAKYQADWDAAAVAEGKQEPWTGEKWREAIRKAGGKAWDDIADPDAYIREMRGDARESECGCVGCPYTITCTFARVRCAGCIRDGRELPPAAPSTPERTADE